MSLSPHDKAVEEAQSVHTDNYGPDGPNEGAHPEIEYLTGWSFIAVGIAIVLSMLLVSFQFFCIQDSPILIRTSRLLWIWYVGQST